MTASVGLALAGNLLTFVLFYELLTLVTYPLVMHRGAEVARLAGRNYLIYTMGGGALLLLATVWLYSLTGTLEYTHRGFLSALDAVHHPALIVIFVLLIAGLGVKAALLPLHGWLPQAMVAPAPVSALLHAVAVVKAGAFGIVRVVYDVYGIEFAASLGVTLPLAILASATIIYGSFRALFQDDLKRRLAFSTVSQVSYVVLGVAVVGPIASIGGLVHLVHQGVQKITLFFCAGILAETLGIHKVSEMNGVGRRMPWTMTAFTIGAFGMIGAPPLAGFISKWYLGLGALDAGQNWVIFILAGSSLLNAAYFLPILYRAWFKAPPDSWPNERTFGRRETAWALLAPPVITAALTLILGLLASAPFSPLELAHYIVSQEYGP
ncbi:MAG: proton-conducting transporter membrane subunit [Candidatus Nitrotoga sp.]